MSTKLRIDFKHAGFREILSNGATDALVASQAQSIASKADAMSIAGSEYNAHTFQGGYGGGRRIGVVSTANYEARLSEATYKSLSKAVM